ncbi:MAG: fimbrillin family protein [Prevotella sp.]
MGLKAREDFSFTLTERADYKTIKMGKYNAEGNTAIVIPCTLTTNDDFLTVKIGTKNYICFPTQQLELEKGKVTTISVTLVRDAIYMSDVNITDWSPGSSDDTIGTLW